MTYELPLAGRRRAGATGPPADVQPGDYWRWGGAWYVAIPGGPIGCIVNHRVIEHDDGTISVPPGPHADGTGTNSIPGKTFHGYIDHGVWVSA